MSGWQGCAGCGNLIPVGGYEWCGGCRPEEQDDGGDVSAQRLESHLLGTRAALARAWHEGWQHYSDHFHPTDPEFGRNPYRDSLREVQAFVTPFDDDAEAHDAK